MDAVTRRRFLAAATGAVAGAVVSRVDARAASAGFRGSLCLFSKHLPSLEAEPLARAVKSLGFAGIDLTVRPGGHVAPERAAEDLPRFLKAVRDEGVAVPMITTALVSSSEPTARPILDTA
jgi:L-ribulose-5-phosphate 3-epimerase